MRIRVDEIPDSGRILHFHWDHGRLSRFLPPDDPFELSLDRPINVDLEINKYTDHIRVTGSIEGLVQVACHRCLTLFGRSLKETVDIFLIPEERVPEEEETELEPDEMDYDFFDGEVIEIDQLVAEQIFLSLPLKVLCSDTCRGLCPGCGVNLNEEECKCKRMAKESPFAKLDAVRARLPKSSR
jgi:uncharacterized protein